MLGALMVVVLLYLGIKVEITDSTDVDVVMTLTKENFTSAVTGNEFLLVNFYAPWCGHCKALTPEFRKAAQAMSASRPSVKFAKIDATENDELAYEQKVRSYPTLLFFRTSYRAQYTGGNEAKDIMSWVTKELAPPVRQLKTSTEVKKFLEENSVAIIGFLDQQNDEKSLLLTAVAVEMKDVVFGMINEQSVIEEFNMSGGDIVLFKPHDERRVVFSGTNNAKTLKRFIQLNSLPLIMEFGRTTASKILHGPTNAFLLFFISNEEEDQLTKYVEPLREIARTYREHVLFVTVAYDGADKKRVFERFGITKKETPTILLIKIDEQEELIKYKPSNKEISIKSVDDFIQQFTEGCLDPYLLSQTLPDDWDEHPVKTLVAKNFYDVAYDNMKTVLVEFYAPWCGLCKQLGPIIQQLAEKYKDNDEIVIAKIDGVSNEVENMKVTAFPTIKLFLNTNTMISYNGARTLEGLDEFLHQNGVFHIERDEL